MPVCTVYILEVWNGHFEVWFTQESVDRRKSVELSSDSAINTYPKAAPTLCRLQNSHQYNKKTKYRMSLKVLINVILKKKEEEKRR